MIYIKRRVASLGTPSGNPVRSSTSSRPTSALLGLNARIPGADVPIKTMVDLRIISPILLARFAVGADESQLPTCVMLRRLADETLTGTKIGRRCQTFATYLRMKAKETTPGTAVEEQRSKGGASIYLNVGLDRILRMFFVLQHPPPPASGG